MFRCLLLPGSAPSALDFASEEESDGEADEDMVARLLQKATRHPSGRNEVVKTGVSLVTLTAPGMPSDNFKLNEESKSPCLQLLYLNPCQRHARYELIVDSTRDGWRLPEKLNRCCGTSVTCPGDGGKDPVRISQCLRNDEEDYSLLNALAGFLNIHPNLARLAATATSSLATWGYQDPADMTVGYDSIKESNFTTTFNAIVPKSKTRRSMEYEADTGLYSTTKGTVEGRGVFTRANYNDPRMRLIPVVGELWKRADIDKHATVEQKKRMVSYKAETAKAWFPPGFREAGSPPL